MRACSLTSEQSGTASLDLCPISCIVHLFKRNDSMRKIETQMIAAIKGNTDWKSANTEVINFYDDEKQLVVTSVYLHGNLIAEVDDCSLKLFDGGYQSKTTKSRLNALLSEFGYTCGTKQEFIFQKQYEWFIQMFDMGQEAMRTIPFTNGMRLA